MLAGRADHVNGTPTLSSSSYASPGTAAEAIAALSTAVGAWRSALLAADDGDLDAIGHSTYPEGSDPQELFIDVIWWVNQEVIHHGAEIALLRDLWRARER